MTFNKNRVRFFVIYSKTLIAALTSVAWATMAQAADITGAGSTFAEPIYTKWASAYRHAGGGVVNYRPVGLTEGLKEVIENQVDFAGSDAPLGDEALAKNGLVQFPTVIGGVVPVVNLPGIKHGELTLSGRVLGDIYLGKIVAWNAPEIIALNPSLTLPDTPIAVVRRLDGSGTTFIWTHYLSQVNADWKSRVGEGASVRWPRGIGGRSNEGVATFVQHLPGEIGYVAWDFTKQNHMSYTSPMLTNEPGTNAWPVVGATFVLMHKT
ncbi:MAG: Phosphate ABC transporter, substrate-binding protein PstS (TC 3.A.1.7.1) [uncultured Paraburkholderia sp.]|nr:MAG: Phosphate ABC transporter, substrate-binding protein PstS (TC 3.A.1.7.1) [uncultured Paraburkholderia sp.]CAH2945900.1 MAG: Phosphate ABC transporter, substrate-binding protein PstS (TC 3.A.1.7.1) [uncultured Paraburkholderia sp.]